MQKQNTLTNENETTRAFLKKLIRMVKQANPAGALQVEQILISKEVITDTEVKLVQQCLDREFDKLEKEIIAGNNTTDIEMLATIQNFMALQYLRQAEMMQKFVEMSQQAK